MQAVILAGGRGTRLAEETQIRPKPMVEIGGRPILWHIMKIFSAGGINDFIICLGYKGYMIKEYFSNYYLHGADVVVDIKSNSLEYLDVRSEPWRITLVDTGEHTQTGGRIRRVAKYLRGHGPFFMTYGDGVANVDVRKILAFHDTNKLDATVTAVRPPARFGTLKLDGSMVSEFVEKPHAMDWSAP